MVRCGTRAECSRLRAGGPQRGLPTSLPAEVAQEIAELIGRQARPDLDLEALEMAARRHVLQLAARAIERCLNAATSDYAGPQLPCSCGSSARYVDRRRKTFQSVLGELEPQRAYYHCSGCPQGFFPRHRVLGLENTSLSPAVTRMIGAVGAPVSFQEGSELLPELAGGSVEAKQVERIAERLGEEVAQHERGDLQPAEQALPGTLYLGLDGTGIPVRASELLGRTGKQADGSAKTREVKLGTIWSAESRDSHGLPVREEGSVTYSAAIESAASPPACRSEFTNRVLREATRRRFSPASRTVAIGDGAPWIWNIAQELFPRGGQGRLRPDRSARPTVDPTTPRRTPRRPLRCPLESSSETCFYRRESTQVPQLPANQSIPHALPRVPSARPMCLPWSGGGRL